MAGDQWQEHHRVFAQPDGRPLDPRSDHQAWKNLLRDAGVAEARLHDARHTAATVMLLMGVPPRVAMQVLGHSQLSMTARYTHVVSEMATEAAERVGEALWGPLATTVAPSAPRSGRT